MANKNFIVKNGITVGGTEVVSSSGVVTSAALGGQIEIPTVDGGKTRVTIPEGSQNTKQFRLRGKGMPILRQKRFGDMYLQITVETPLNLSKKQKELLKEFENLSSKENNPESHGFFEKIKEFWGGVNKQ